MCSSDLLTLDFRALAAAGGSPPINSLVPTTWVLSHRFELSFAVGGGGTWDVIPGFLTLAAPVALLVGDQGVWTLHLQERLQLFGAAFVLDIAVPSLTGTVILAASLATGPVEAAPAPVAARAGDAPPPVNTTEALAEAAAAKATAAFTLGGLLAHFGLHDTGGLGAVGVTACAVSFDGSQHAASLSLQFVAAKITLGEFSATMQSLEVGYVGGVGGGVTASLHVSLVVAGTTVELWASHPGPGLGWQFSGSWTAGATPSTLAKLCKDLGVAIPDPLGDLALKSLDVSHDTASGTLHFAVEVDYHTATLVLTFDKCTTGADSTWQMAGTLKLHDVELDVVLVKTTDGGSSEKLLLASLGTTGPGLDLVSALGLFGVPTAGLPAVTVHRAMLVWDSVKPNPAASSAGEEGGVPANNILAAADLDLSIDFSGLRRLPLIGEHLPANSTIGAAVSAAYAKGFDNLPPPEVVPYVPATAPSLSGVARGSLSLSAQVTVGTHRFHLSDPSTGAPTVGPSPTAALVAPPVAPALASPGGLAAQVSWTPVGLHLGAIELRRIGHAMEGQTITILLDGSVTIAVLTLDLMGLGLAYDLATRTPAFAFLGVGFALHKDPLLVSAAFMNIDGDFAGTASVVTSTFGLTALGAFSEIGGTPSVFLYGVLEYPIGGPPFFFVEGLAGGFGINRHLTMPPVSGVSDFPFVKAVSGGTPPSIGPIGSAGETVTDQLTQLHDYISPSRGRCSLPRG